MYVLVSYTSLPGRVVVQTSADWVTMVLTTGTAGETISEVLAQAETSEVDVVSQPVWQATVGMVTVFHSVVV
jgi:hypothetical protein